MTDPQGPAPRRGVATAGILVGLLLSALDGTLVATALPRILDELRGFDLYFLPNAAFMLLQTVSVPLWGRLSDLHGRRAYHLAAMAILVGGSVLCGFSTSMETLTAARAVQGVGAGGLMALSLTMIADLYQGGERARIQGAVSSVWGVAALLGPFLGAWITETWSWRGIFWINLPIGLVAATIVRAGWVETPRASRGRTDFVGAALLALSSASLLSYFGLAGNRGWTSAPALGSLVAAALLGAGLVAFERRQADPFLAYDLFRSRLFAVGAATGVCAMICMFGAILHVPLLVTGVQGATLQQGGLMLSCMVAPWVVCSAASKSLLSRFSIRALGMTGMVFAGAAYVVLSLPSATTSFTPVIASMLLLGVALGLTVAPLLIVVQNSIPRERLGAATSLTQFSRSMGAGLGIAVMGSLLTASFGGREPEGIIRFRAQMDPTALRAAVEPLARGLQHVFHAGLAAAVLGFLCASVLPAPDSPPPSPPSPLP